MCYLVVTGVCFESCHHKIAYDCQRLSAFAFAHDAERKPAPRAMSAPPPNASATEPWR